MSGAGANLDPRRRTYGDRRPVSHAHDLTVCDVDRHLMDANLIACQQRFEPGAQPEPPRPCRPVGPVRGTTDERQPHHVAAGGSSELPSPAPHARLDRPLVDANGRAPESPRTLDDRLREMHLYGAPGSRHGAIVACLYCWRQVIALHAAGSSARGA